MWLHSGGRTVSKHRHDCGCAVGLIKAVHWSVRLINAVFTWRSVWDTLGYKHAVHEAMEQVFRISVLVKLSENNRTFVTHSPTLAAVRGFARHQWDYLWLPCYSHKYLFAPNRQITSLHMSRKLASKKKTKNACVFEFRSIAELSTHQRLYCSSRSSHPPHYRP